MPFDLVILDHGMDGMDGREVAQELRHLDVTVPIIMNSGTAGVSSVVGSLVDACLAKGEGFNFLLAAISDLLSSSKTAGADQPI